MTVVNVATLKEKLSYYLQLVRSGSVVVVTSHDTKIARIVPIASPSTETIQPKLASLRSAKIKGGQAASSISGRTFDRRSQEKMKVYLDTSVVLRKLFRERNPVRIWGKWDQAYSTTLWRTEAFRAVDRLRLGGDLSDMDVSELAAQIEVVHQTLVLVPVTEAILRRASEAFPTVVGTSGCNSSFDSPGDSRDGKD